jgi:hypothetical protein
LSVSFGHQLANAASGLTLLVIVASDNAFDLLYLPAIAATDLDWPWQLSALTQAGNGTTVDAQQFFQVLNSEKRLKARARRMRRHQIVCGHVLLHKGEAEMVWDYRSSHSSNQLKAKCTCSNEGKHREANHIVWNAQLSL